MDIYTITAREFDQVVSEAQLAANKAPVLITEAGLPTHVLMSAEHYREITGSEPELAQSLGMPTIGNVERLLDPE